MTWAKVDDRANEHPKLLEVGAKAAWLWVCGLMYCNRQSKKTGRIPKVVISNGMLYPGLSTSEAKRLVLAGLWLDLGGEYEVHQYNGWNPELSEKRAQAGRSGGLRSAEARREATDQATEQANLKQVASADTSNLLDETEANEFDDASLAHSRARTHAQPRAGSTPLHPTPGEEDPPTPTKPVRDAFAKSFGPLPQKRPDVLRLHEAWKREFARENTPLVVGYNNSDAEILADRIDACGLEDSILVAKYAKDDGMVSGREDETKAKHESIRYIFGNNEAFSRILRDAKAKERAKAGGSATSEIARRKAAGGDE